MKNPPILISVIGFFAALAGFAWLFLGLRILGFDWFGALGDLPAFEQAGLWGWLAIGAGILWLAGRVRPLGAPAVGLDVRHDRRRPQPSSRRSSAFFQFPGTGDRARHGDHAGRSSSCT